MHVQFRIMESRHVSVVCVVLYNPHFRAHPPSSSQTFLLNTWELYKCVVNDNPVVHSSSTSQPIRSVHCSFILNSHTWTECVHQIFSRRHFTLDSISYLSTCQISDMVVLSLVVQWAVIFVLGRFSNPCELSRTELFLSKLFAERRRPLQGKKAFPSRPRKWLEIGNTVKPTRHHRHTNEWIQQQTA